MTIPLDLDGLFHHSSLIGGNGQFVGFAFFHRNAQMIVSIETFILGSTLKDKLSGGLPQLNRSRAAIAGLFVKDSKHKLHHALWHGCSKRGVAIRDVDSMHLVRTTLPDHGKGLWGAAKGNRVNGMAATLALGFRGSPNEPRLIQGITRRFGSPGKVPALIPHLHPGVIAAPITPKGNSDKTGRNTHRATRIDQEDAQPSAGG